MRAIVGKADATAIALGEMFLTGDRTYPVIANLSITAGVVAGAAVIDVCSRVDTAAIAVGEARLARGRALAVIADFSSVADDPARATIVWVAREVHAGGTALSVTQGAGIRDLLRVVSIGISAPHGQKERERREERERTMGTGMGEA